MIPIPSSGQGNTRPPAQPDKARPARTHSVKPNVPPITKLLVKPGEASELMGVSRSTIYELMRSGELDSVLIRSSRRIPVAAIERYIERLLDNRSEEERRD